MKYVSDSSVFLHDIHFYAFHGVGKQERKVGNDFCIDIRLKYDIRVAAFHDEVTNVVSYVDVFQVLKEEMAIPSNLLEHVCTRIVERLFRKFPIVEEIQIRLAKRNPPMGADILEAGVEMNCKRD
jgi:7,8-dihydroneopterin aldolase/epimerase/oxygenase